MVVPNLGLGTPVVEWTGEKKVKWRITPVGVIVGSLWTTQVVLFLTYYRKRTIGEALTMLIEYNMTLIMRILSSITSVMDDLPEPVKDPAGYLTQTSNAIRDYYRGLGYSV